MSQIIEWSDVLNLGIEEIDNQHKDLLGLVNEMHLAIRDSRGREAVAKVLARLADYIKIHFAVEESLMRILGYPGYEGHKAQHEELIRSVLDLQRRVDTDKMAIGVELMHYLKTWLTRHIVESDRDYGRFFMEAGDKARDCRASWATRRWDPLRD